MRGLGTVVAVGLAGIAAAVLAVHAATRLDRLHVRTDAAWAALDAALSRRARAVGALGNSAVTPREGGVAVLTAAEVALRATPGLRADAENELGRALAVLDLATVDAARVAELADAEQRVVIARRVYNDAVRDTLALRSRRLVRWLHLAGTAPLPRYFDIAEATVSTDPAEPGLPG
ncbi:MAG: NUDIX hydrolase [Pseudonocardiaceae bacterium]